MHFVAKQQGCNNDKWKIIAELSF